MNEYPTYEPEPGSNRPPDREPDPAIGIIIIVLLFGVFALVGYGFQSYIEMLGTALSGG